jgi:hypothetical protein
VRFADTGQLRRQWAGTCDEFQDTFFCKEHAQAHIAAEHDEDEAGLMPVVNSPRMGVCGYTGPREDRYEIRRR